MSASFPVTGPPTVGIDFGTTNSVVAILHPDGAVRTQRAPGLDVFRTVLCFWAERGALRHAAGPGAVAAYLDDPEDTRLIMSMKTYLAQRSFTSTQVMGRPFTLEALVALFLRGLLAGQDLDGARITAGRPVRFAGELADDALARPGCASPSARPGWARWTWPTSRRPPASASPARSPPPPPC